MDKTKSGDTKQPVQLSKNDLLKYRDLPQSSNDDESKGSNFDVCLLHCYYKYVNFVNIIFVI